MQWTEQGATAGGRHPPVVAIELEFIELVPYIFSFLWAQTL